MITLYHLLFHIDLLELGNVLIICPRCLGFRIYVHQKRYAFSPSLYLCSHQGNALSLPNLVTYPLCFLTAYKMKSRPRVVALAQD